MTEAGSWLEILKAVLVALAGGGLLNALLPYLWQGETRRLQAESEARVKRLEAIEKGISVAAKAKTELGIEISTCDLQSGLQRIAHEFGDPVALSREALEEWAKQPWVYRGQADVKFTVPEYYRRTSRNQRHIPWLFPLIVFLFLFPELHSGSSGEAIFLIRIFGLTMVLSPLLATVIRERTLKKALSTLRAMSENQAVQKRADSLAGAPESETVGSVVGSPA